MAGSIPAVADNPREKYFFLIRRLHSLSGLFPIGFYVTFHIIANATVLAGGEKFQFVVDQIHQLHQAGVLFPVEMAFIFLPIAFHAVLGVVIILGATPNVGSYRYGPNIGYTLQRTTAVIALFFIILHVWQMHWMGKPFGGGSFDPHQAPVTAAAAIQAQWWYIPAYVIGVGATIYHLSYGIWTALITWGITLGRRAQRVSGYICLAFGIGLFVVGMGAIKGFASFDTNGTTQTEPAHTAALHAEHDAD